MWETENEITNHKVRKRTEIISMKGKNGQAFRKNKEIANCLIEHFNTIGHKLANEIKTAISETTTLESSDNSLYIFDTFDEEIRKLMDRLKINKAPGLDGINIYIFKISAIAVILTRM